MERRNRAPDPAICASDDRHLSCQPLRISVTGLPLGLGSQSAFAAGQWVLVEHLLRVVISLLLVSGSTPDRSAGAIHPEQTVCSCFAPLEGFLFDPMPLVARRRQERETNRAKTRRFMTAAPVPLTEPAPTRRRFQGMPY